MNRKFISYQSKQVDLQCIQK